MDVYIHMPEFYEFLNINLYKVIKNNIMYVIYEIYYNKRGLNHTNIPYITNYKNVLTEARLSPSEVVLIRRKRQKRRKRGRKHDPC
jgi:hypothetical protein